MRQGTGEQLLAEIGSDAPRRALVAGDVLVRHGEGVDAVFVVISGGLDALTPGSRGQSLVGHVDAGQVVGEVAAVAGGNRTATLVATEPTEVAVIERAGFEAWLAERPDVADEISAEARDRIDRMQLVAMFDEDFPDALGRRPGRPRYLHCELQLRLRSLRLVS